MQIYPHHLYSVPNFNGGTGMCAAGARQWCASHGLSWAEFVSHGLPEETLTATGDAMALRLVAHAHDTQAGQGTQHG